MTYRDSKVSLTAILSSEEINRAVAEFLMKRYKCDGTWNADIEWNFNVKCASELSHEVAEQVVKGVTIVDAKVSMRKKETR